MHHGEETGAYNDAYPMPVYKQVHTIGNAAFGGLHDGFSRVVYQVFTSLRVT